jgi:hypothetical protein
MQPVVYEVIEALLTVHPSSSSSSTTTSPGHNNSNNASHFVDQQTTSSSSSTSARASVDHVGLRAFERFFVNPTIQGEPELRPLLSKVIKGTIHILLQCNFLLFFCFFFGSNFNIYSLILFSSFYFSRCSGGCG